MFVHTSVSKNEFLHTMIVTYHKGLAFFPHLSLTIEAASTDDEEKKKESKQYNLAEEIAVSTESYRGFSLF